MKNVISLGAGVQSSTMALMAAHGELTPMPDCAIFADTQAEPASVYRWLDWLGPKLPFPVHRVTAGNLSAAALLLKTSAKGTTYTKHSVPAYIVDAEGKSGLLMRQCTTSFKIEPIQRKMRELRGGEPAVQWIGISTDEAHRMKPAREPWLTNRWPLIEAAMRRTDCLRWMADHGYPIPPRSACVFCPYHSNEEWRHLRDEEPEAFTAAVAFEGELQKTMSAVSGFRGTPYLHRGLRPLAESDLSAPLLPLFGNECEGMCGN